VSCVGDMERANKHLIIAASAGEFRAMYNLITNFKFGIITQDVRSMQL
jgi:hypothetical protein